VKLWRAFFEAAKEPRPTHHHCRFDIDDPRFKRVQALFERARDEDLVEARRILRRLVVEFAATYKLSSKEREGAD
jgi:hypothetical protein